MNFESCEFCEISQKTFSCRTPPVAACDKTFKRRTGHVQFKSCVQVVCEKVQLIVSVKLYYLIILSFILSQLTNFKSLHEHDRNYYLGPWQISMMKLVATIVKSFFFQTHSMYLWEYLGIARHLELVKRSVYPFFISTCNSLITKNQKLRFVVVKIDKIVSKKLN